MTSTRSLMDSFNRIAGGGQHHNQGLIKANPVTWGLAGAIEQGGQQPELG